MAALVSSSRAGRASVTVAVGINQVRDEAIVDRSSASRDEQQARVRTETRACDGLDSEPGTSTTLADSAFSAATLSGARPAASHEFVRA
jgi:hypothetical protein